MPPTFLLSFIFENPTPGLKAQARSKIAQYAAAEKSPAGRVGY
jgi:hypothetical protein